MIVLVSVNNWEGSLKNRVVSVNYSSYIHYFIVHF